MQSPWQHSAEESHVPPRGTHWTGGGLQRPSWHWPVQQSEFAVQAACWHMPEVAFGGMMQKRPEAHWLVSVQLPVASAMQPGRQTRV